MGIVEPGTCAWLGQGQFLLLPAIYLALTVHPLTIRLRCASSACPAEPALAVLAAMRCFNRPQQCGAFQARCLGS